MTVDACDAGKDVYVEKPLTHDLSRGQSVIDAQNSNKRIVQVGTQQRSMPHIIKANELIKKGRIGQVFKVHMSLEPQHIRRDSSVAAGSTRSRSTGRRSSATRPISRSTSTASATGAGSGISAADF